ncbi:uncharacterized protein LOC111365576 [Olea europaea var. sylvestris]|uniref:uncharacterized protein LOC111365576 n=1 Tax=Olea europaea var. sylvestris TaxID=158386 RepID=UPI000C1D5E4D|nr:uncharacterized protein LOC111365576 [Olea europaea var. sylvestris]
MSPSYPTSIKKVNVMQLKKFRKLIRTPHSSQRSIDLCELFGDFFYSFCNDANQRFELGKSWDVSVSVEYAEKIGKGNISRQPYVLPSSKIYGHCGATKFYRESKGFCCCDENVKLQLHDIPPEMYDLFTSTSKETVAFKKVVRNYNNHFAFTSFSVKYMKELCKNNKAIYTFRVQGQVYHFINSLVLKNDNPTSLSEVNHLESCCILLKSNPGVDQRIYNSPTLEQVVVVWNLIEFNHVHFADQLLEVEDYVLKVKKKRITVSCREYYCYKLQMRCVNNCILLHASRLLQQYVVDMYVKIETARLDYFHNNQKVIRAELYERIVDSVQNGENTGYKIGRSLVLPSDFVGSPRNMTKRYMDAMSIIQRYGKPDVFLTMTYNPNWLEIKCELKESDEIQNRPDLFVRIFRAKFEELKADLVKRKLLDPIAAYAYVIEFQKRGLPHTHFLLIF